ncbi:MAG: arginine--tRNA ligase [Planctomycetota bacterium]
MNIPGLLRERFAVVLEPMVEQVDNLLGMIRPTTDPKMGDYQANFAMPLAKRLQRDPIELAEEIIGKVDLADLADRVEVAGRGFINVHLSDDFLAKQLVVISQDERHGISKPIDPQTILVDYSSPNVAKPMHVGHIRSTVIGDALSRIFRYLGHQVITDNHLGDWGTQFGMIIYGYKHFGEADKVKQNPVAELSSLYRYVHELMGLRAGQKRIDQMEDLIAKAKDDLSTLEHENNASNGDDPKSQKKFNKKLKSLRAKRDSLLKEQISLQEKLEIAESDSSLWKDLSDHREIETAVLEETAKLHQGDETNLRLWNDFLPFCIDEIDRVYKRLHVEFDHTLGESFYHPMLSGVIERLEKLDLITKSDGAKCVFLDGFEAPMIVQKRDGAYLYATTDLATLKYRLEEFNVDEILYVVDSRQSEHFDKLFAAAEKIFDQDLRLAHIQFGTVLGKDGKPMKTRSGTLIGLEGLLDDAVTRASEVVCNPERLASFDPPMSEDEQKDIAESVGIGAVKFVDLSHHRTSDYRFDLEKMVSLEGNTSTYVQYSYARTQAILHRVGADGRTSWDDGSKTPPVISHQAERELVLSLLRFEEALQGVRQDDAPNHLTDYLISTARSYSRFNESCRVIDAGNEHVKNTRIMLVRTTGEILKTGLDLLGIRVVRRM